MSDEKYLDDGLAKQLVETGVLHHNDEKCLWTDKYWPFCTRRISASFIP